MIAEREYRYLSPSFIIDKASTEILKLCGAGLVHHPALELTALASQETAMNPLSPADDAQDEGSEAALFKAVVGLLGLSEGTPLAEVVAVLKAMSDRVKAPPDPAKYVPVEAVRAMMLDRRHELASASEGRAQEKVNAAFRQGYLPGGLRDWALALCRSDEAAFDTFLQKSGPAYGHLLRQSAAAAPFPGHTADPVQTQTEATLCSQLGLKPGSLKV